MAIVLIGGALFEGARALSRQRSRLQSAQQQIEPLEQQLAEARRQREATAAELALAERQFAELTGPTEAELNEAERARNAEIAAWLMRIKRLKQLFEQHPDQRIPEMRLLKDDDWLRVTKGVGLNDEESIRKAFAGVRSAAKRHFATSLMRALPKFAKVSKGEPPATVLALAPYLENPADAEFLTHVEVTRVARLEEYAKRGVLDWAVQEKNAVDPDYDSRYRINGNGGSMIAPAPQAWIPDFPERSQRAYREFAAANHGVTPAGIAQMLPYFSPPLDAATAEKLIKAERAGWR